MEHWADYVIFVVFILISLGIGIYHAFTGGKQRTTQEFIMGDRKLKLLPTTLSMLVSYQSAIMILGFTAEMYTQGTQNWLMGMIGSSLAIIFAERLFVPWLYPLRLTSVFKYFELRFPGNKVVRIIAATLGVTASILYMGASIYAPAVALETATSFPAVASIPIMAVVCVIYTSLGGIKAVVWTDVFQFLIIFAGMLTILIKGALVVGGLPKALDLAKEHGRLLWGDISADPTIRHTVWGFLIGWPMNWGFLYGLQQGSVQRYSAVTSLEHARLVLLLNIPALVFLISLSSMIGIIVLGHYAMTECDPLVSQRVNHGNQLLPLFVKEVFRDMHGFSGLFIATLFSGALSSVSSSLSGSAANAWEDVLKLKLSHLSEYKASIVNKFLVLVFGAIATGVAFLAALMPGPISQVSLSLVGSVSGPLLGMFLLCGIRLFRWVDWKGVFVGGIVGIIINLWVSFGSITIKGHRFQLPPVSIDGCDPPLNSTVPILPVNVTGVSKFYTLSYLWYVPLGCLVTIIIGLIISAILYKSCKTEKISVIEEHLFIPFRDICRFKSRDTSAHDSSKHESFNEGHENSLDVSRSVTPLSVVMRPNGGRRNWKDRSIVSEGRISISESDKFTILDVSSISDGSYTQYNPPLVTSETNL